MSDDAKNGAYKAPFMTRVFRKLIALAVIGVVVILLFATWANHRSDGVWSFRVFDSAWWGVGQAEAKPYVDGARTAAGKAYEGVWGKDGLVDKGEEWLKSKDEPHAEDTHAPGTADSIAAAAPDRTAHEVGLNAAQESFERGLISYRMAKPKGPEGKPDQTAVTDAVAEFRQARDLLNKHLPTYSQLPGRNLRILADAEELQQLNSSLLNKAEAMR